MPRPLYPHPFAILQLTIRILTLLASLACIVISLYVSLNFFRTNQVLYLALTWSVILDNAEILALTARPGDGMKRLGLYVLITLELVDNFFFMVAGFISFMDTHQNGRVGLEPIKDRLGAELLVAQWSGSLAILCLHFVLILLCGFDGWNHRRLPSQRRRSST